MSIKTTTLSVRVPIDVATMVANTCKQRGINRNQLLTECIASQGVVGVNSFELGGTTEPMNEILNLWSFVIQENQALNLNLHPLQKMVN